jgi:hypothetical protein
MNNRVYSIPDSLQGQDGMLIGGGWHNFSFIETFIGTKLCVTEPDDCDFSFLVALGFIETSAFPLPLPEPEPEPEEKKKGK